MPGLFWFNAFAATHVTVQATSALPYLQVARTVLAHYSCTRRQVSNLPIASVSKIHNHCGLPLFG